LTFDLFGRHFDFIGKVKQRAAVSVVEMHLDEIPDDPLIDQPLGGNMGFDPRERPIDGHQFAGGFHRSHHAAGITCRSGKGFFDEQVDAVGGEPFGIAGVIRRGRTQDCQVRICRIHASIEFGENSVLGNREVGNGVGHLVRIRIENPDNLGVRMVLNHPQQIAHMHVVEADRSNTEF